MDDDDSNEQIMSNEDYEREGQQLDSKMASDFAEVLKYKNSLPPPPPPGNFFLN